MLMSQAVFRSAVPVERRESGFSYSFLPTSKILLGSSQNKKKKYISLSTGQMNLQ